LRRRIRLPSLAGRVSEARVDELLRVEGIPRTLTPGIGSAAHEGSTADQALPLAWRQKVQDLRDVHERPRHARVEVELQAHILAELIERLPTERLALRPAEVMAYQASQARMMRLAALSGDARHR
jgi:hypothetical protein